MKNDVASAGTFRALEANSPLRSSNDDNGQCQANGQAYSTINIRTTDSSCSFEFSDPGTDGRQSTTESIHSTLKHLAADTAMSVDEGGDMLEVVEEGEEASAKHIDKECSKGESGNSGIQVEWDIETEQTAQRSENEGEQDLGAPVFVRRKDSQDDGTEPGSKCDEDHESVETLASKQGVERW